MKVRAIDFVVVNVSDMDRSMRFYRDTLGVPFPLTEDGKNWKEFDTPPVALELARVGPAPGQVSLALAVDDVAAAVACLPGIFDRWRGAAARHS
jgi:catechol 2,3-dioxygenase-like lactoylglutathione lyase family enzyme